MPRYSNSGKFEYTNNQKFSKTPMNPAEEYQSKTFSPIEDRIAYDISNHEVFTPKYGPLTSYDSKSNMTKRQNRSGGAPSGGGAPTNQSM